MSRKRLPFLERRAGHLAVGLATVTAAGLIAFQFRGSPNAVDGIHPATVDDALRTTAERLRGSIAPEAPTSVTVPDSAPRSTRFDRTLAAAVTLGLGSAVAEVYAFHDGRWWREAFAVEPGDRVGQVKTLDGRDETYDFDTGWFVADVLDRDDRMLVVLRDCADPDAHRVLDPNTASTDPELLGLLQRVREDRD